MNPTLIVNARLVNEGREFDSDLRIENGRIARIDTGLSAQSKDIVIDAAGRRFTAWHDRRPSPFSRTWTHPQGRYCQRVRCCSGRRTDELYGYAQHQSTDIRRRCIAGQV